MWVCIWVLVEMAAIYSPLAVLAHRYDVIDVGGCFGGLCMTFGWAGSLAKHYCNAIDSLGLLGNIKYYSADSYKASIQSQYACLTRDSFACTSPCIMSAICESLVSSLRPSHGQPFALSTEQRCAFIQFWRRLLDTTRAQLICVLERFFIENVFYSRKHLDKVKPWKS